MTRWWLDNLLNFSQAVAKTNVQEEEISILLSKIYSAPVQRYDFNVEFFDGAILTEPMLLYEVKDERNMAYKTGNHFVELQSRSKASGISKTKSDLWVVQILEGVVYIVNTPDLVLGICNNINKGWKTVRGGDRDSNGTPTSLGVLVPLTWLADTGTAYEFDKEYSFNQIQSHRV